MTTDDPTADLRTVHLLEIPLSVYARSTQHFEELMREFALISLDTDREAAADGGSRPVPERLQTLVHELTENFSAFTVDTEAERDAALARGESTIDLTYRIPPQVTGASRELSALLEEVDDYCRAGQHLITLATPPESVAFRAWYLDEFIGQLEQGRDPMPWDEYVARNHADAEWARDQLPSG